MQADVIIAGAGCAGLALAHRVSTLEPSARVIVLDRDLCPARTQLWSYWATEPEHAELLPGLELRSWAAARVALPGRVRTQTIAPLRYYTIRSEDYRARMLNSLRRRPNVRLVETPVLELLEDASGVEVRSGIGKFHAPHCFQSLAPAPRDLRVPARFPLRQQFHGWIVRTKAPTFDSSTFTWMDFAVDQRLGLSFVYALPLSAREQFVEFTVLTRQSLPRWALAASLADHIRLRYPQVESVEVRESGSIPMSDRQLGPYWSGPEGPRRIFNLGAAGGMIKPSTGYAFRRSQMQARHLARSWRAGRPTPLPGNSRRFRFYDMTLLQLLCERPELGREFFAGLLRRGDLRRVLRFLDEDSSLLDELLLFRDLPKLASLRAAPRAMLALRAGRPRAALPEVA